ncbi:TPA: phosphoribosylamine--glycine ligase [Clostridioides difficile]|uniref:Phosphoribosylamine--glycine ligase n=5 Tax=Clostridioides difficile TaxID=1496 RepID=Q18CW4_CLOD6|nr:phosphoribosylamine--glycine ligase [Clostridioides difficile]EQF88924.1 phosphoribosylamine--glycine ligase [Clostridioides difficile CD196]EQG78572.1 phosphoribosylamine--glycine ligase [Clostridioides difficile DA00165]OFU08804.1 phosphoribosylamine--glycine ligase [Clostridium sp. HMSC19C11]OFU27330.1 phosphoribosylamine--glycine ligase [Clostridium sp. HMSC19B12]OFU37689.1 phosphoribosylamine--glycine ligase [Clostridium sp. HMSC19B04]OFU43615.1 phosphoribosylamine--glycine ligase [Cl
MKILVVGGGGREHAICWKLSKEKNVEKIYCAPGNAGIANVAECVNIGDTNIEELLKFAKENEIGLTIVGPEVPLVMGIVDEFEKEGLRVFGPNKKCAQLEGSKAFSKEFMIKHNIPTAKYKEYTNLEEAISEIDSFGYPVVIKADGLAAGKGVVIPENREDAIATLKEMMSDKKFGAAGDKIVIEEFLKGIETSILAFVDNDTIVPMASAKDHKKVNNYEQGPNTGGMGTFSPSEIYTEELANKVKETVLEKTLEGFKKDGLNFKGILFVGLMITEDGEKVLEYNVRFGDPETQSVLFRLETDLHEIMEAILDNKLKDIEINYSDDEAVCVMLTSGGYPDSYEKGKIITGLENLDDDIVVFHSGTKMFDGNLVTNGGRVIGITAKSTTVKDAAEKVYENIKKINFEGMHYRTDIGR